MASYETTIAGHTVTIHHQQGGTNQIGVKKPTRVKAWAVCPVSGKQHQEASHSVGEATRAVERALQESITGADAEKVAEPV